MNVSKNWYFLHCTLPEVSEKVQYLVINVNCVQKTPAHSHKEQGDLNGGQILSLNRVLTVLKFSFSLHSERIFAQWFDASCSRSRLAPRATAKHPSRYDFMQYLPNDVS